MDQTALESLRNYAATDSFARRAFELLAQRQRKRTELAVEVLMRDMGCPRADAVKFLKRLGKLECGRFYAGRGSKQSRFRWRYAMYSVAQVALGQPASLEALPWDDDDVGQEDDSQELGDGAVPPQTGPVAAAMDTPASAFAPLPRRLINHTYPLRPDLLVPIGLPADLTAQEADRLAAFIRALAVMPCTDGKSLDK